VSRTFNTTLEPSQTCSDNDTTCDFGGTCCLHMSVKGSLAHCADCFLVLPVTCSELASDGYLVHVGSKGIIITWPTFNAAGEEEVARA